MGLPLIVAMTRMLAALVLGAVIGMEREWRRKPAGLRTHMLVSIAACLFIIVSQHLGSLPFGVGNEVQIDPLRLIEADAEGSHNIWHRNIDDTAGYHHHKGCSHSGHSDK